VRRLAGWLLPLLAVALLNGCSWLRGGEDNVEPPAELKDITPTVTLDRLWAADVGDGIDEQFLRLVPAVDGGRVFAADHKGRVAAFEAASGKPVWEVKTGVHVTGGVGTGEGLILVGGSEAEVVALDWRDGSEVWRSQVSSEVLGVPAAARGLVVVQSVDGNLTALDAATGARRWVFDRSVPVLSLRGTSSPLLIESYAITGLASGKAVAVELARGLPIWETAVAIPSGRSELDRMVDIDAPLQLRGSQLYAVTYQGRVAALDGPTGRLLWARDISSAAGLGVDDRQVYVSDDQDQLWAFDRRSGAAVWKLDDFRRRQLTAPAVLGDYVVVGDYEGYLHVITRDDGRIVGRARVDSKGILAPPRVVDDVLYVYGNGGTLAAYALR